MSSDDELNLVIREGDLFPGRLTRNPAKNHGGCLDYYGPPLELQIAGRWLHADTFDLSRSGSVSILRLRLLRWIDAPTIDENGDPISGSSSGPVDFAKHLRF